MMYDVQANSSYLPKFSKGYGMRKRKKRERERQDSEAQVQETRINSTR